MAKGHLQRVWSRPFPARETENKINKKYQQNTKKTKLTNQQQHKTINKVAVYNVVAGQGFPLSKMSVLYANNIFALHLKAVENPAALTINITPCLIAKAFY